MKGKVYRRLALASIIIGILVVNLKSFLLITGAVVGVSTVVSRTSFWIGLVFILVGFVLTFMARRPRVSDFVAKSNSGVGIIITNKFLKSMKGANLDKINDALRKIGTGLGKQHLLTTKSYSISAGGAGKINFDYNPKENTAKIQRYGNGHD